jgi:hypothetical protein
MSATTADEIIVGTINAVELRTEWPCTRGEAGLDATRAPTADLIPGQSPRWWRVGLYAGHRPNSGVPSEYQARTRRQAAARPPIGISGTRPYVREQRLSEVQPSPGSLDRLVKRVWSRGAPVDPAQRS